MLHLGKELVIKKNVALLSTPYKGQKMLHLEHCSKWKVNCGRGRLGSGNENEEERKLDNRIGDPTPQYSQRYNN